VSSRLEQADVVVIGAGIVGNSVVKHLAEKGWRKIVLVDKGPLPDPGGSTGHASNFIFPVDHGKEIALLTLESQRQFEELGVQTTCGGIEVARTEERMEELRRRMASSKTWGVESHLISPKEVVDLVPYVNPDIILGGFYTPSVSVVDSLQAGVLMRQRASALAALSVYPSTKVLGIDTENGRVTRVRTDKGDFETSTVVIACGVWAPRIARMAGASVPLVPMVHQLINVGPIPMLEQTRTEIAFPIIRDMDTFMYERQNGGDMEIGSYAHRPIIHEPDDIPSIEESLLSPTQLPFTSDDFDPQMEDALELMPELLNTPGAGVRHAINGLLSLTPDGSPILGESPDVKGLWSANAVWIKEGPGVGKLIAEWMTDGEPEIDPHSSDIARFYPHQLTRRHRNCRTSEGFNKTYGIVHPREQWATNRQVRLSPFYERECKLGAVFFEAAGWERPQWYESNAPLVDEYRDRVEQREHEWDARWWSPITTAEHLAMRDRVAMIDLTAFAIFDVTGPRACDYLQRITVANVDRAPGRIIYTPVLSYGGGFRSDLTILRLGPDHYRVITGGADGPRDLKWFSDHLPEDGSAQISDLTSAICTLGVWGPKARDVLAPLVEEDISNAAFPFGSAQWVTLGSVQALMVRISYVGELGWEIHVPMEQGARLWDDVREAGQQHGIIPAGAGVYGTSGRMEKGYRLMGAELELEYNAVEAGLALPRVKSADFIGKEAYLRAREEEPAATLCTLTVDGNHRYMMGREPILTTDGERIVDRKGRSSYVTSAGPGPSVGKYLLMTYLPPEHAVEDNTLLVEYMGEQYPVTVARAGRKPLFDPDDERMKV
jgi:heterotetrameric sarcosine oxidase gamma subunit